MIRKDKLFQMCMLWLFLMASGCVSLLPGANKSQTEFVLKTSRCEAPPAPPRSKPSLLISTPKASTFIYSTRIIFSRDEQTRGAYQFAFWTEPPPDRIAIILENELLCRGRFSKISRNSFPADYILRFELTDFRHDISSNPGEAVVEMALELLDAKTGALIGAHKNKIRHAATSYDAAGAVIALNQAAHQEVISLTDWLLKVVP